MMASASASYASSEPAGASKSSLMRTNAERRSLSDSIIGAFVILMARGSSKSPDFIFAQSRVALMAANPSNQNALMLIVDPRDDSPLVPANVKVVSTANDVGLAERCAHICKAGPGCRFRFTEPQAHRHFGRRVLLIPVISQRRKREDSHTIILPTIFHNGRFRYRRSGAAQLDRRDRSSSRHELKGSTVC